MFTAPCPIPLPFRALPRILRNTLNNSSETGSLVMFSIAVERPAVFFFLIVYDVLDQFVICNFHILMKDALHHLFWAFIVFIMKECWVLPSVLIEPLLHL